MAETAPNYLELEVTEFTPITASRISAEAGGLTVQPELYEEYLALIYAGVDPAVAFNRVFGAATNTPIGANVSQEASRQVVANIQLYEILAANDPRYAYLQIDTSQYGQETITAAEEELRRRAQKPLTEEEQLARKQELGVLDQPSLVKLLSTPQPQGFNYG